MLLLNRLPAWLHVAALRSAHRVRRTWWKLGWRLGRRPVRGCRVLVFDGAGRVLLVRHSYGDGRWMLPGGGLARGEDPALGAAREVLEEVGCRLDPVLAVGLAADSAVTSPHQVHLVAGWTRDLPAADGREIVAAAFFAADALPAPLSPRVAAALPDQITRVKAARRSAGG